MAVSANLGIGAQFYIDSASYRWMRFLRKSLITMLMYDLLLLQYSEKDLYTQLCYLQHVFDITKPPHSSVRCSVDTFNAYCALKEHVARTLSCSGYSVVSLTKLFRGLFPEPIKIKKEPVDDSWKFIFCVQGKSLTMRVKLEVL